MSATDRDGDSVSPFPRKAVDIERENTALRERLREAEETLEAIRNGDVDAVVVGGVDGAPQVYTLETADHTYRVLVEQMQEGALTVSNDGTVLYCNRRFAELVRMPAERIVGGALDRFVAGGDAGELIRALAAGTAKTELTLATSAQVRSPAYFSFSPLGAESPDTLCCVVTDLTEQRRSGEALRVAHERLLVEVSERERTESLLRQSQKMEAVGQLTGGVAHDFNNLLMVISGGLDMLERQTDPGRRDRLLSGMRQASARGAGLTRQLLAFSRQQALRPELVDLVRQVGGMRELLDRSLRGDVQVRTEFADDQWPVCVDAGELELVLLNLCVNARDAMPDGGLITIGAENVKAPDRAGLDGDFVRLSVRDTGTGMLPEVVTRAFEPFFTTKEVGKGSGLGLAQAYGFAQASDGQIGIESAPGQGTTIFLLLPRSQKEPRAVGSAGAARVLASPAATGSAGCILLVEDDDEVAELAREMLLQLGYDVTRVASAQAALGALADHRHIDLVFSDVMMPGGMNGVELMRELHRRRPDLPIVLTSGYADIIKRDVAAVNVYVLPKPYRFEDLAEALKAASRAIEGSPNLK